MIAADIRGEQEAIACYTRALDAISDPEMRAVIEKIRGEEERHLAILKEMRAAL